MQKKSAKGNLCSKRDKRSLIAMILSLLFALPIYMSASKYTVKADDEAGAYSEYIPGGNERPVELENKQVTFNGMKWYIIEDNSLSRTSGTVTLFAVNPIGMSRYDQYNHNYKGSEICMYLENLTTGDGSFASVSHVIKNIDLEDVDVTGVKLYLLSKDEVSLLPKNVKICDVYEEEYYGNRWWLRTADTYRDRVWHVQGWDRGDVVSSMCGYSFAVRPALQLDLEQVRFSPQTKTFEVHTHDWSVSTDGETATVACLADDCSYTGEYTATISADNKIYDGSPVEVTLTQSEGFPSEFSFRTITYTGRDGTTYSGNTVPPSAIGKYRAQVYFEWPYEDGYTGNSISVDFEISEKYTVVFTSKPEAKNLTYSGSAQELVTKGEAEGGTVCYALGDNGETPPEFDGMSSSLDRKWSTSVPTAVDPGKYFVWYMAIGDEHYEDTVPKVVEVMIMPKYGSCPFVDVSERAYYYDAVMWAINQEPAVTSGVDETHFKPKDSCTRAQVVTLLWRIKGCPEPTIENPFSDIKEKSYYYKAVLWALEKGITAGTSPNTFEPNVTCNRAQFITFLWRLAGEPDMVGTVNPFVDVKAGKYYANAILWAYENEITSGTDDTHFSPMDIVSRGQSISFIHRFSGKVK